MANLLIKYGKGLGKARGRVGGGGGVVGVGVVVLVVVVAKPYCRRPISHVTGHYRTEPVS